MPRPAGSVNKVSKSTDDPKLFGDWLNSAKDILKEKDLELKKIQHDIVCAATGLKNINDNIIKERNDWEREKRRLRQDFDNELNLKKRKLDEEAHRLEFGAMEHNKRMEEVQAREERVLKLEEEKKRLSQERIEIEKLNMSLGDLEIKTKERLSIADDKLHRANIILEEHNKKQAALKLEEAGLTALDDRLKNEKIAIDKEKVNVEKVRKEIEPLVDGYKKQENSLQVERQKLEQERIALQDKISEERNLFSILEEEKRKIDLQKREIAQKNEEIKRLILFKEEKV